MATRIYTSTGAGGISPTISSAWEANGVDGAATGRTAAKPGTANYVQVAPTAQPGSGVANDDTVMLQLVYGPIVAGAITGTVKGQLLAREVSGSTDARAQVIIRLMAPDGTTVRGTMLAMDTAALSSEFLISSTSAVRNIQMPRGGAQTLTSQTAQDGDYIVIEAGFRNHGTNTSNVRIHSGEPSATTDLPENETQAADTTSGSTYRGWFEFSQTISPLTQASAQTSSATGLANNASTTIAPVVNVATATGLANDATISFVAPPRSLTINGTEYIGDSMFSGFSLTECANRGEVGSGGFDVLDGVSAMDIPAMKAVLFEEPAAGQSNKRVFTGFTHERSMAALSDQALTARAWGVECVDLNILASDYVLTNAETADRPAETDYVRVAWLLTTALNSVGGVGVGVVPNANTVTMEATDYRGRKAADLLAECSEAAQKLWFIYDYGAGRLLYYDLATNTDLSSSVYLSDKAGDPDNSTVFKVLSATLKKSPDRIYSKVHLTYNGGTVTVSNGTTASTYRQREAAILDSSISDSTLATVKANALLAGAASEVVEIEGLTTILPAAHINDIRAGQRVQIKLTRYGLSSYTYYRVVRKTVQPYQNQTHYLVTLALASDVLASANGARGGDEIWPQKSNANDDGATVIVDRNGINIIDGAITVVNSAATTIIDGESEIFQILTTNTQNATATAHNLTSATITESGLGAFAACPVVLTIHSIGNIATTAQSVGEVSQGISGEFFSAQVSGGSPTSPHFMRSDWTAGQCLLDGSSYVKVYILVHNNGGSSITRYQKYFVLDKTSF